MPTHLLDEATALAQEMSTTPNDAIVRLAEEGVAARQRLRRVEEIAQARRAAVARVVSEDAAESPPADVLREAMLSGRRDDD